MTTTCERRAALGQIGELTTLRHACKVAGITYRQGRFWVDSGYIAAKNVTAKGEPAPEGKVAHTGYFAALEPTEVQVIAVMGRLVRAGLLAERAAALARLVIASPDRTVEVEPGFSITLKESA